MIPYMGSKRISAGKIFQAISNLHPNGGMLVDLFCGGFAISEYFYKNGWRVIANDKNKYVIALLKTIIFDSIEENKLTKFVTRKMFEDIKNNPDNYEDWYVGFVQCCWSFGNNQRGYLFGKNVESIKKAGHEIVINKNPEFIQKLITDIPQKYIDGIIKQDTWHKRRIALCKVSDKLKMRLEQLQQLQQMQHLQRLEQLERLERLEQLQQLERLELSSMDYREVKIPKGAIIYCDPPYKGTTEYKENEFNHNEFFEWVKIKSENNPIYFSEYQSPEKFKKILEFGRNSTLCSGYNKKQPNECLFTIGE